MKLQLRIICIKFIPWLGYICWKNDIWQRRGSRQLWQKIVARKMVTNKFVSCHPHVVPSAACERSLTLPLNETGATMTGGITSEREEKYYRLLLSKIHKLHLVRLMRQKTQDSIPTCDFYHFFPVNLGIRNFPLFYSLNIQAVKYLYY